MYFLTFTQSTLQKLYTLIKHEDSQIEALLLMLCPTGRNYNQTQGFFWEIKKKSAKLGLNMSKTKSCTCQGHFLTTCIRHYQNHQSSQCVSSKVSS